ncbi:MAG: cation diffusion facilitator family transporter [Deltaproteobacteria bacterium]
MKIREQYVLPKDKEDKLDRAKKLEWVSIFFLLSITVIMYITMGSSQAMKTAWVEDVLSLVPPISFLIALKYRNKPPDENFPYGYKRAVQIAFLCAATALLFFGIYLLYEAVKNLTERIHPTIGLVKIFGLHIWMGWIMIAALIYSAIPPLILGRMKLPLAKELHEKTLYTDASMNKADWITALAAVFGILGIGIGWWWADSVAAGVISLDILKDGVTNMKRVIADLMDRRPTTVESGDPEDIDELIKNELIKLSWVLDVDVRLREEGHVFTGEIFIIPDNETGIIDKLKEASELAASLDWRIHNVIALPVREL